MIIHTSDELAASVTDHMALSADPRPQFHGRLNLGLVLGLYLITNFPSSAPEDQDIVTDSIYDISQIVS